MAENNVAAQAGDEPMWTAFEAIAPAHRITIERFKQRPDSYKFEYTLQQYAFFKAAYEAGQAAQVSPRATADVEREMKRHAERVERLVRAAKVYTFNYLLDEHEEAELCTCGPKQHAELVELFAALAAIATTKTGA